MIVGISGQAGSGKDTVADVLVEHFGATKIALADPMKRFCAEVFGFTHDELWGPSELRNRPRADLGGLTARRALQLLGTEWGRACFEDVWVRHGIARATSLDAPLVVISDVRFKNEIAALKVAGGVLVRVVRPGAKLNGAAGVHASESEQSGMSDDDFDVVIQNDASLDCLIVAARSLGEGLLQERERTNA